MRHILRQREWHADPGVILARTSSGATPLIVPLAELRAAREHWWAWPGRLGVRLAPVDRVED